MHFLKDLVVMFGLAVGVALICHRLKIPTIVGLILTGVIAGPHGLGLVLEIHTVELLAEIGIIFLLFTIGLEFSIASIAHVRRLFFLGGPLQVGITTVVVALVCASTGIRTQQSILFGMIASLSSTAIILKILQERSELTSPHGKGAMAILIFQDIAFVPMMLLIPFLAGVASDNILHEVLILLAKIAAIWLVIGLAAPRVVPRILTGIARTQSNELFLLSVGVLCFFVAYLTSLAGLSLALGAFLAGLVLSDSEHSHRALENVLPFRDVFSSFFFVSMGMLVDAAYVTQHLPAVLAVAAGIIVLKTLIAAGVMLSLGLPYRVSTMTGLSLAQVGEFSLLVLSAALAVNLVGEGMYQFTLSACLFSLAAAPFVTNAAHRIADLGARLPLPVKIREGRYYVTDDADEGLKDHIVIVGYGVIGAMVGHSARLCDIKYESIEISYDIVMEQRARGVPIFYGDATQEASLVKANIKDARVCVVAIPDPTGAARVVSLARRLNPDMQIIARVRYVRDMVKLYSLGANEVVSEETEASIKMFSIVLEKYGVDAETIEGFGGIPQKR